MRLPPSPKNREDDDRSDEPDGLSLRWAVILLTTALAGTLCGLLAGPVAGVGTGLAAAGVLHQILR